MKMADTQLLTADKAPEALAFLNSMNMPLGVKELDILLAKNPGLSQVALAEGKIVGIILASYDGIKGYLNKLVVHPDQRKGGIGQQLVSAATAALQQAGANEVLINCRPFLAHWYEKQGFVKDESVPYVRRFTEKSADCS